MRPLKARSKDRLDGSIHRGDGFLFSILRTLLVASTALVSQVGDAPAADDRSAKPLFELGLVGVGGYVPDYPGANQNHIKGAALPYVVYRGGVIRAGEGSLLKGRIVRRDRLELDVSLNGSFPTDSDDNDARRGMPDLDFLGEIGPRLQLTLATAAKYAKVDLELPIRAVFSTDLTNFRFRGVVFHPKIAYQHQNFYDSGLKVKLSVGPIIASKRLMRYFYEVDPAFVTAGRSAFSAGAGYVGTEARLSVAARLTDRINLFGLGTASVYRGATNENSPLLKAKQTFGINVGLSYSFYQSDRTGSK